MPKPVLILLARALSAGVGGCVAMQEARIESDYSYSGNFRRYRTYDFIQMHGLFSDSSRLGRVLRRSVRSICDRYRILAEGYVLAPEASNGGQ